MPFRKNSERGQPRIGARQFFQFGQFASARRTPCCPEIENYRSPHQLIGSHNAAVKQGQAELRRRRRYWNKSGSQDVATGKHKPKVAHPQRTTQPRVNQANARVGIM